MQEVFNKPCAKCGKPLANQRKKFCDNVCQYRFNAAKKENEKDLPPVRKRTKDWCFVYTSYTNSISGRGQGRRSGGMIKGGMAANVSIAVEELKPFTFTNMEEHFKQKQGHPYVPNYIRLGDGTRLSKDDAENYLINQDTARYAAHC